MQLTHFKDVPFRSIDIGLELINALMSRDDSRLTELRYITAVLAGDEELADCISSSFT